MCIVLSQFYFYKKNLVSTIKTVSLTQIHNALCDFACRDTIFGIDDVVAYLHLQDYEPDLPPREPSPLFIPEIEVDDSEDVLESTPIDPKTNRKRKRSANQEEKKEEEEEKEDEEEIEESDDNVDGIVYATKEELLAQIEGREKEREQERNRDLLTFTMMEEERKKARDEEMQNMMEREMFRQDEKQKDRNLTQHIYLTY